MLLELNCVHQIPCCYEYFGKYLRMHISRHKHFLKPNYSYDCKANITNKNCISKNSVSEY